MDEQQRHAIESLDSSQREKLDTFLAVTNLDSQVDGFRRLNACGWDLNAAVDAFLSGAAPPPSASLTSAQPVHRNHPQHSQLQNPQPATTSSNVNSTHDQSNPSNVFRHMLRFLFVPLRAAWSLLSIVAQRILNYLGLQPPLLTSPEGRSAAADFAHQFALQFGNESSTTDANSAGASITQLVFFTGLFQEALRRASREFRFVLAFIHSESNEDSENFRATVLRDSTFVRFVNESFVFWAVSNKFAEAAALRRALRVSRYPCLAVLRTRAGSSSGPSELVALKQGHVSAAEVVQWLQRVMERFGVSLTAARIEQEERDASRQLREQQDLEFARALEEDRDRENQKRMEKQRAEQRELKLKQRMEAKEAREIADRERRVQKQASLPEPLPKGAPESASIVLRLPDGSRLAYCFASSAPLEVLFDWADANGVNINAACLVSSYPRKSFKWPEDAKLTFEESGLSPSCMLLVEERLDVAVDDDDTSGSDPGDPSEALHGTSDVSVNGNEKKRQ
uniref:UBX domain-containing protein n=1 Tax=Timspurckia oligopyrenoides TaxID=708627 RepID=A0A7S0ZCT7_9RHOD|mmetsp:Transcript_12805/g.23026  ORF Transcript_12805/g.23026 Transcript_12805/m.23026 type:complete len:510 (+) Transcript_12805:70-1599(+)|eukprot:CAMPEP_0182448974 /NCGR_PEP_ID=MMETSP1172-20130603/31110_1 /TAXON_ID=708627 /ORGANISM="Timspurckia oligopyrenoides, Strain CCMP3278" /LENGTH=509 /DNA_ID=CAMNT_0024646049 /DNA_START=46 /DNA_END=1575 /DNA_ORIENTATION=+